MATRHLLALGLAALVSVGASSAMAGTFSLQAQGPTFISSGDTVVFDVIYSRSIGDPDVFGMDLRVFLGSQTQTSGSIIFGFPDQQFSIVNPLAPVPTAVFDFPTSAIILPSFDDNTVTCIAPTDPGSIFNLFPITCGGDDLFAVQLGGAQVGLPPDGIPFDTPTKIGEFAFTAIGPGGQVDHLLHPGFTGVVGDGLVPIPLDPGQAVLLGSISVPEPSFMLMLGMSLGALALIRRRA